MRLILFTFHNVLKLLWQVEEYKNDLIKKAETLILKGFPEKILQLNDLLETPMFQNRDFDSVFHDLDIPVPDPILLNNNHEEDEPPPSKRKRGGAAVVAAAEKPSGDNTGGTKVMALPTGMIRTNSPICEIIKVVKPVIRKLVEDCEYRGRSICRQKH